MWYTFTLILGIILLVVSLFLFKERRRDYFAKLTDEKITLMQLAYRKIFELGPVE
jgi:hypothetical protein